MGEGIPTRASSPSLARTFRHREGAVGPGRKARLVLLFAWHHPRRDEPERQDRDCAVAGARAGGWRLWVERRDERRWGRLELPARGGRDEVGHQRRVRRARHDCRRQLAGLPSVASTEIAARCGPRFVYILCSRWR